MTGIRIRAVLLVSALLFLAGCTPSGALRGEPNRTTDTYSAAFETAAEKLTFLCEYLTTPSAVLDAEYHVVYSDNSARPVPGPSDWDIRAVLKVAPESVPLWTEGMKKALPGQMDDAWWEGLNAEQLMGEARGEPEYYKRPGEQVYLIAYPESGTLLKMVSTTYMPDLAEYMEYIAGYEGLDGYEDDKLALIDRLGYDMSVLPYIRATQTETGRLAPGTESTIVLLEVRIYGSSAFSLPVLVANTAGELLYYPLPSASYNTEFSLADVDGDGYEELITHQLMGGIGGMSSHNSGVYKTDSGGLRTLFYDIGYVSEVSGLDTGFSLALADGWTHTITNQYTGSAVTFVRDMSDPEWRYPYFDKDGSLRAGEPYDGAFHVDSSFYLFRPVDADGDGVFEIMAAQYTSLFGHSDGVGTAYTLLKWDVAAETMRVTRAGFFPYPAEGESWEEYEPRAQEYEENWYKN